MDITRRRLLQAGAALPLAGIARAQDSAFPSRPITIIVSSAAGALPDQSARLYGERMSAFLRQPVVVENMAGAGGLLAARRVAGAQPDGYTLLSVANTVVVQPLLNSKAGYTMKSLTPVGEAARAPLLLVTSASSPYKTFQDLIAAAKRTPAQITYGSSGVGTTNHLMPELLASKVGVKFMHVPYKGISAALPDVVSARVGFAMSTATSFQELIRSGALRPLAITSSQRSPAFPEVPTLTELGYPDSAFDVWIGLFAPAGLPAAVKARLAEAMEAARADQKLVQTLQGAGQEISAVRTPDQFAAVVGADEDKIRKVIREANLPVE